MNEEKYILVGRCFSLIGSGIANEFKIKSYVRSALAGVLLATGLVGCATENSGGQANNEEPIYNRGVTFSDLMGAMGRQDPAGKAMTAFIRAGEDQQLAEIRAEEMRRAIKKESDRVIQAQREEQVRREIERYKNDVRAPRHPSIDGKLTVYLSVGEESDDAIVGHPATEENEIKVIKVNKERLYVHVRNFKESDEMNIKLFVKNADGKTIIDSYVPQLRKNQFGGSNLGPWNYNSVEDWRGNYKSIIVYSQGTITNEFIVR